jgi:hypothetical protein
MLSSLFIIIKKIMFIKKKNFFNYQNQIVLTNGSTLKISSIKYIKNKELNKSFLKDFNKIKKEIIIKENIFLNKIKKK